MLWRFTANPPPGAFPLSVTLPVAVCPYPRLAGLKDSRTTTGGPTARVAVWAFPLGRVAVMLALAFALCGDVPVVNVVAVAPPAKLMLAGTVATLVRLLASVAVRPAGGAGPLRVSVPVELMPPVTDAGLNVNDAMAAGFTVKTAVALLEPSVAVRLTFFAAATPAVLPVNVCDELPAGTTTDAGTLTDGSELLSPTVIPPLPAAELSVTAPVDAVPPVTDCGDMLSAVIVTVTAGLTATVPAAVAVPVVPTTIATSGLLTVVVATEKV